MSNQSALVSFIAPVNNGGTPITSYTVTSNPGGIQVSGPASPILVTGLSNGVSYTFTVTATNAAGTGPASTPSNSVIPATVPSTMAAPVATPGNAQAVVSFSTPSNGGKPITSYRVTASPGGASVVGSASPLTISGLTNGTPYTFTVFATNAVGNGTPSPSSASVTPATVPATMAAPTAVRGNAQATVSFTPPANGGSPITGYSVVSTPSSVTQTGAASPIVVPGLANGTTYTFTVKAMNAIGSGSPSPASNAVTPATVPSTMTAPTAAGGNAQATVSFTAPFNGGSPITSYLVTSSPGGFTGSGGSSPIIVGGLTNGVSYTFSATATNAIGTSAASPASNAITPTGAGATPVFNFPSFDSTIVPSQVFVVTNNGGLSTPFISLINANQGHSDGGAWYQTIQDIHLGFTTDFTFQFVGSPATAGGLPVISGMTFAVQNDARGPTIGGDANSDGYGSFPEFAGNIPIRNSIGVKFSIGNGGQGYFNRPTGKLNFTGLYFNGGYADNLVPGNDIQPYGIDMNAGNIMHGFVTYDGSTLTLTILDTVTNAQARYSWPVTIPTFLGQNTGYVGFGAGNVSNVQIKLLSWAFSRGFNARLATPTFSVAPGRYTGTQSVSISGTGSIYYTTNGLEPTTSSTLYAGTPISIAANTILKAIAIQAGSTDSFVATGNYQIAAGGTPLINFPSGFASSTGLLNLVGRAALSGSSVVLTDGTNPPSAGEIGGMWYPAPVTTSTFTSSFQFNLAAGTARGIAFVLQNLPASSTSISGSTGGPFALSNGGGQKGMGFGGNGIVNSGGNLLTQQTLGFSPSVGLAIGPIGGSGSWVGVFTNGALPTTAGSTNVAGTLNFQSGHNFRADLSYSGGTTLSVTITDLTTSTALPLTFTVNIASIIGSTGFVGFTGADYGGGAQKINTWTM